MDKSGIYEEIRNRFESEIEEKSEKESIMSKRYQRVANSLILSMNDRVFEDEMRRRKGMSIRY